MIYAQPGSENAIVNFKSHYDNFIGGEWVKPTGGEYFDNISPINGKPYCKVARSGEADINLALMQHTTSEKSGRKPALQSVLIFF